MVWLLSLHQPEGTGRPTKTKKQENEEHGND
jgi:hypothetical protein